jgi:hypothetical protein
MNNREKAYLACTRYLSDIADVLSSIMIITKNNYQNVRIDKVVAVERELSLLRSYVRDEFNKITDLLEWGKHDN